MCPVDFFCPAGSASPQACPVGYVCGTPGLASPVSDRHFVELKDTAHAGDVLTWLSIATSPSLFQSYLVTCQMDGSCAGVTEAGVGLSSVAPTYTSVGSTVYAKLLGPLCDSGTWLNTTCCGAAATLCSQVRACLRGRVCTCVSMGKRLSCLCRRKNVLSFFFFFFHLFLFWHCEVPWTGVLVLGCSVALAGTALPPAPWRTRRSSARGRARARPAPTALARARAPRPRAHPALPADGAVELPAPRVSAARDGGRGCGRAVTAPRRAVHVRLWIRLWRWQRVCGGDGLPGRLLLRRRKYAERTGVRVSLSVCDAHACCARSVLLDSTVQR